MKKLFVLLLALIVAASAFAQLTVAGYDKAKATFNSDTKAGTFEDEIRANLSAKDADGKYGFSGRFQGTSNTNMSEFATKFMYGWVSFLDGMIKVSGGRLNEGGYQWGMNEANSIQGNLDTDSAPEAKYAGVAYGTFGDFHDYRQQAMEITLAPMDGLKASVIYAPDGDSVTGSNFTYGAAYSIENLANIKAAFTSNKAGDVLGHFGVEYVGVEGLSAVLGGKLMSDYAFDALDPTEEGGMFFGIWSIVGYTMDKLFLEFGGQYNLESEYLDASYYLEGNVEYTDATYSVRVFGQYNDSDQKGVGNIFDLGGVGDYLVGAELSLPFGTSGTEFNAGFNYSDASELSVPVYVKVYF